MGSDKKPTIEQDGVARSASTRSPSTSTCLEGAARRDRGVNVMKAAASIFIAGMVVQATIPVPIARAQNADELDRLFEEEDLEEPVGSFNEAPPPPPPPPTDFGNAAGDSQFSNDPPPGDFAPPPPSNFGGGSFGSGSSTRSGSRPTRNNRNNTTSTTPRTTAPRTADPNKPGLSTAQIEDITNENYPDLIESFDYPNAEITDVIKAISQLTGKNFIIDPGVRGKISIVAPTQITVAEAYKAFLSALAINGFTVVPSGKFLKVKSARNAQRDSIDTYSGQYYPNSDLMITRIIHLKHISAEEVNKRLRILPSKDGEMTPYEPTNSLIVSDYGANIERIMKIINELDRPGFEEQLEVMPIRHAKAKDLADLVNQIINKEPTRGGAAAPGGFGAGVPRFRSRGGTPGGGTPEELSLVAPDDRTNAIIVVGNKAGIQKVRDLVRKLDYKLDPSESGGVNVYYVKYGEAEKIAQTLSGLAQSSGPSGSTGGPSSMPGGFAPRAASPLDRPQLFGGDVKITADKTTNSLVITASKQDYEAVMSILAKLDIPRSQVFVEAIIMEMSSNKVNSWNPTYYYLDPASKGVGRAGFSSAGSLQNLLNPTGDSGTILGFGTGATVDFTNPVNGQTIKVPSLLAFIQLLQSNTEANILSTPRILAMDNEEAEIEVGDTIPVGQTTTTATNGQTSNSIDREKATIKLNITPFIRPDSDVVRLKLTQTIKQLSDKPVRAQNLANSSVVTSDRAIKTNIVVNNGDTAVLGGLIRDEESVRETKVPVLGDIPVLGWLFKSKSISKDKVNLTVFLTPKIIRSTADGQNLLNAETNTRVDWIKKNFDGRDPYGSKVDTLPRSSANRQDEGGADMDREPQSVKKKKTIKR